MSVLLNNQVQYTAEKGVLFYPSSLKGALFIICVKFSDFRVMSGFWGYRIVK